MARPSKFSEELGERICALHKRGLPLKSCAKKCRINRSTLQRWLKKGKEARSGKYKEFYLDWLQADAEYELYHIDHISDAPSWLAHQYLLQVRDPETYVVADKQEMETTVKADATINADVDFTSDEFMSRELELMKQLIEDKKE